MSVSDLGQRLRAVGCLAVEFQTARIGTAQAQPFGHVCAAQRDKPQHRIGRQFQRGLKMHHWPQKTVVTARQNL